MTIDPARTPHFDALAGRLAHAWQSRTRIEGVSEAERPANRPEAFAIQSRILELIGGQGSGWKIGATSAGCTHKTAPMAASGAHRITLCPR